MYTRILAYNRGGTGTLVNKNRKTVCAVVVGGTSRELLRYYLFIFIANVWIMVSVYKLQRDDNIIVAVTIIRPPTTCSAHVKSETVSAGWHFLLLSSSSRNNYDHHHINIITAIGKTCLFLFFVGPLRRERRIIYTIVVAVTYMWYVYTSRVWCLGDSKSETNIKQCEL